MAWKKYSELTPEEKAKRAAAKKVTNSIVSPQTKALIKKLANKRTISTDWS